MSIPEVQVSMETVRLVQEKLGERMQLLMEVLSKSDIPNDDYTIAAMFNIGMTRIMTHLMFMEMESQPVEKPGPRLVVP